MCQHCGFSYIIVGITISKSNRRKVCVNACWKVAEQCKEIKVKHFAYLDKFPCFNRISFKKTIDMLLLNPNLITKIGFRHV